LHIGERVAHVMNPCTSSPPTAPTPVGASHTPKRFDQHPGGPVVKEGRSFPPIGLRPFGRPVKARLLFPKASSPGCQPPPGLTLRVKSNRVPLIGGRHPPLWPRHWAAHPSRPAGRSPQHSKLRRRGRLAAYLGSIRHDRRTKAVCGPGPFHRRVQWRPRREPEFDRAYDSRPSAHYAGQNSGMSRGSPLTTSQAK